MKKLFLFTCLTALTLSFNSCSDDDSKATEDPTDDTVYVDGGTVSVKVNGELKTYNTIAVEDDGDADFPRLYVTASQNGSSSEFVTFSIDKGNVGAGHVLGFSYTTDSTPNQQFEPFSSNTLVNEDHVVKANFSGKLVTGQNPLGNGFTYDEFTDGSINITYN